MNKSNRKGSPVSLSDCGMAMAAKLLGDRWLLLIIRESFYGVRRFGIIKDDIGIPRAVLSDRLTKLVAMEVLKQVPYREPGQREHYEYVLTKNGEDLFPVLVALMQWGDSHLRKGSASKISLRNIHTNGKLRTAVIDREGSEVHQLKDVKFVVR